VARLSDGRWLGEVSMPASFGVREIGVEYVERYAILKD
jgi:hypothetical protein